MLLAVKWSLYVGGKEVCNPRRAIPGNTYPESHVPLPPSTVPFELHIYPCQAPWTYHPCSHFRSRNLGHDMT